jgi:hypothetical protein
VAGVEAFGVLNPNDFSDQPPQFRAANEDFHSCVCRKFDSTSTQATHGVSSRRDDRPAQAILPFWLRCKSRAELEAENLILRQQINVLRRRMPKRPALTNIDRLLFVWLYRWFPSTVGALAIARPETIIRWHRSGFRAYWRWRSRNCVGRPKVSAELRALIREMSRANPLWGSPRIHGELLKLGFDVAQSTVAKYMARRLGPPSQEWKTFLRNHVPHIGAIDMFVVPTVGFRLLYGLVILRLNRRRLVWISVTSNPTADWIARQITEAFTGIRRPGISFATETPHMAIS